MNPDNPKRTKTAALMAANAQGPANSTNGLSFAEFMRLLRGIA